MSDVSENLQIRTDAPDQVVVRLRELGFNGFVFLGQHGWLTAIPYGGPGSLGISDERLAKFAAQLGAPVLNYQVSDFTWGFQLALPDRRTTGFIRWLIDDPAAWGIPPEALKPNHLDETILAAVVPLNRVRRFLGPTRLPVKQGFEWELFAQAAGFPVYDQQNPAYATDHPDEMREIGGIEIGHRPQSRRGPASP